MNLQTAMDTAHKANEIDKLERQIVRLLAEAGQHETSARIARSLADKLTNDRAILLEAHNYTQDELEKAWELVAPADWKDPVCAMIPVTVDGRLIRAAVSHFTATVARLHVMGNKVRVSAIGYRGGPAGDH